MFRRHHLRDRTSKCAFHISHFTTFTYSARQVLKDGAATINDGPNGLQRLDKVIAAAKNHQIKLLLTLTNNWNPVRPQPSSSFNRRHNDVLPRGYLSNDYGMSVPFYVSNGYRWFPQVAWTSTSIRSILAEHMTCSIQIRLLSANSRNMFLMSSLVTLTIQRYWDGSSPTTRVAVLPYLPLQLVVHIRLPAGLMTFVCVQRTSSFRNGLMTSEAGYIKQLDSNHLITAGYAHSPWCLSDWN